SSGTILPTFSSGTTGYSVAEANSVSSVTVTPTASDATATIKINGVTVASGSASSAIALVVGSNTITAVVTAQDGVASKKYSLTVNRATPPSGFPWTGAGANSNWNNSNNWSPSGFPTAGQAATIGATSNMPSVNVVSACSSLTITVATTLSMPASLTVG